MENQVKQLTRKKCRKNERGAALVTVLMISVLLFVAAAALLMEATMNTANVTDAIAEEQAYYAAESGIQSVINVLRGNTVLPTSLLIDPSKPATDLANKIDYRKAVRRSDSNRNGDSATESRMSRWLDYDNGNFSDRIILGTTTGLPTYTKRDGLAYKVSIQDPDNLDDKVSYYTSGLLNYGSSSSWTNPSGSLTITYVPTTVTDKDASSGLAETNFGRFRITGVGTISSRIRFAINVNMTKPYNAVKLIRGFIEPGEITLTSPGSVRLFYDSQVFILLGSEITLSNGNVVEQQTPTIRYGYEVTPRPPAASNLPDEGFGETLIRGTITLPEPTRLLIRSTGFGPRGATKQLETLIYKNHFDNLGAPSPLLLIGPPSATFNPGTATNTTYSGLDVQKRAHLPPIGVTNDTNLAIINNMVSSSSSFKGKVFGTTANVASELPPWLQTPTALQATINKLKEVAIASGRYYGPGVSPPASGNYGDVVNAKGITFIDGNLDFSQEGGGILVVTGDLKITGGFTWNGLMVITGAGGMVRSGGGGGFLQGNMIIAPYNKNNLGNPNILLDGFLTPKYDIGGGGNSSTEFNSNRVDAGLSALSNFVKGVAEK
ncbi:MAG TPA: hypothetical protein VK308_16990 [Pyrinomonadaceae bacterium]|nr:hypothetical protein [Pyrinomonadaceae bacterium]